MTARVCKQGHVKATQLYMDASLPHWNGSRFAGKVRGLVDIRGKTGIFAVMKEYQAVILRLSHRVREDEDALTDLLNERSRGGWDPELMTQDSERFTIVFARRAESGR